MVRRAIALALAALSLAGAAAPDGAHAATVRQEQVYQFTSGRLAGETLTLVYTYPTLPPGQDILGYDPVLGGSATLADAVAGPPGGSLIFTDSQDILNPEYATAFDFDPDANSLRVFFVTQQSLTVTITFDDPPNNVGPDVFADCRAGGNADCAFTTTVIPIPLPPGIALIVAALGLLGWLGHGRRGRISGAPDPAWT